MNAKEATDILHSLTQEKRVEAVELHNYFVQNTQGGNWQGLSKQQKQMIEIAFLIEYGRRTPGKK